MSPTHEWGTRSWKRRLHVRRPVWLPSTHAWTFRLEQQSGSVNHDALPTTELLLLSLTCKFNIIIAIGMLIHLSVPKVEQGKQHAVSYILTHANYSDTKSCLWPCDIYFWINRLNFRQTLCWHARHLTPKPTFSYCLQSGVYQIPKCIATESWPLW